MFWEGEAEALASRGEEVTDSWSVGDAAAAAGELLGAGCFELELLEEMAGLPAAEIWDVEGVGELDRDLEGVGVRVGVRVRVEVGVKEGDFVGLFEGVMDVEGSLEGDGVGEGNATPMFCWICCCDARATEENNSPMEQVTKQEMSKE